MRITRDLLVRRLAAQCRMTRAQASAVLDSLFGSMGRALAAGDEVRLHRFGKFFVRPKRRARGAAGVASKTLPPASTVGFNAFGRLRERCNPSLAEDLEHAVLAAPPVERRRVPRDDSPADATAIVRISGIPVCEFSLTSYSPGGSAFLVPEDATILRNIRVGQEIDVRIHRNGLPEGAVLQRCRIAHITRATTPELQGFFVLGIQILGELPI